MGKKQRTRTRKSRQREYVTYIIAIEKWDWDFSFGINSNPKLDSDPFYDYRHLNIFGVVVSPSIYKGKRAELTFLPNQELNKSNRQDQPWQHAGSLSSEKHRFWGLFSIPADVVDSLLQMLVSSRHNWVVLHGEPFRYRKTSISGFRLQSTFDDDDLPADE